MEVELRFSKVHYNEYCSTDKDSEQEDDDCPNILTNTATLMFLI